MGFPALATHLVGGYMNYTFLGKLANGDSRYKITFNVYRDCDDGIPLDNTIKLGVYLNDAATSLNQNPVFSLIRKQKVDAPGSVDCPDIRANVCIEEGLYEGILTLKPYSEGYHITYTMCCRNTQANIIQTGNDPSQGQTYYCFIPNTDLENNSPSFYGVPSPYMCVNDTTSFLFDAIDRDGDSLSYRFMRPFNSGGVGVIVLEPSPQLDTPLLAYRPGFSFRQPFGAAGHVFIDNQTGYTELFSTLTGRFVLGVEVREFRNGVLISTTRLDLSIIVLDCAPNKTPEIFSDKDNRLRVEAGDEICFNVTATDENDPNGDIVRLKGRGGLLGVGGAIDGTLATFSDAAGQPKVTSEFCWIPDCDAARSEPYIAYFTVEDGGCPPKSNNLDIVIYVDPFVGAELLEGPGEVCQGDKALYQVTDGKQASTFEWAIEEGEIEGSNTTAEVLVRWNGSGTGLVRVREVSAGGCLGDWIVKDVLLVSSPPNPTIVGRDTVCENEVGLVYTVSELVGVSYYWNTVNATSGVMINANTISIQDYNEPFFIVQSAITNDLGCASDTVFKEVFVSVPNPEISGPTVVCPNAIGIIYIAEGSMNSSYQWNLQGGNIASGGTSNTISVDWGNEGAGTVQVEEINFLGCRSEPVELSVNKTYNLEVNSIVGQNEVCEFDLGEIYEVEESSGSVYDWFVAGGTQVFGDSSARIGVDWDVAGAASVRVIQRAFDAVNARNCLSAPFDLPIIIHPKPISDAIIGATEVCQAADSVDYTIIGFSNSTYRWSINGNDQGIAGQGTNTATIFWGLSGAFMLSVQEISENGCQGETIDTLIIVNSKPVTSPIEGENIICPTRFEGQVYSVSGFSTSSFIWLVHGGQSVAQDGTSTITVDWDTTQGKGTIKVVEISDKGCNGDTIYLDISIDRLAIDLRFVSVGTPDDRMIIDWQLLNNSTADELKLQKRIADVGNVWQTIATVPGTTTNYLEAGINTDLYPFEYRIVGMNKCDVLISSEPHTNIWLSGEQDESFNSVLQFTDYFGWENGVKIYDLLLEDNLSAYRIEYSNAIPIESLSLPHNPKQFRKCFRVQAKEQDGEETTSLSNEICFFFSPEVYVPNAFTANNDGLNDGFGVKGVAINEFEISIFNRWGEKLYTSSNIDQKWIPEYRGADVQMGTYVYVIKYTDFENKIYQKTGTIILLR